MIHEFNKSVEQEKLMLGGNEIKLCSEYMKFNENTLSEYYQTESGYYDYYSAQLASADHILMIRENDYDTTYSDMFVKCKDEGGSDKYAEAKTRATPEVSEAAKAVALAKYKKNLLQQYLRSWDRNHENALALGHMLRKEMDKLNMTIKEKPGSGYSHKFYDMLENKIGPKEIDIEAMEREYLGDKSVKNDSI